MSTKEVNVHTGGGCCFGCCLVPTIIVWLLFFGGCGKIVDLIDSTIAANRAAAERTTK